MARKKHNFFDALITPANQFNRAVKKAIGFHSPTRIAERQMSGKHIKTSGLQELKRMGWKTVKGYDAHTGKPRKYLKDNAGKLYKMVGGQLVKV